MDEVDFTILAATSVLSDLIEKCPPAEACRDAFNRMSKATVQMCMSTTGFSTNTQGLSSKKQRSQRDSDMGLDYFGAPVGNQFAISNSRQSRTTSSHNHRTSSSSGKQPQAVDRQKPQFDMGLNDLFQVPTGVAKIQSPELQTQQLYSSQNNGTRGVKHEYSSVDAFGIPTNQIHSPSDYAMSPLQAQVPLSGDTSAIDPSLLPSPRHQEQAQLQAYIPSDQNTMTYGHSFADLDFPLQGMDFLGSGGVDGAHGAGMEGQAGLDLGFGLGWEGIDHDFSEGNQLDIFDGRLLGHYSPFL
jgi:hypothetical protein